MEVANVGLFMGINQCTEVAKESYDIIISSNNFASIFYALRWGRCVYSNVQKFAQFLLMASIAALLANCLGPLSAQELPLTAVQLLWVSLVTDALGSLAFATEKPTKQDKKKPPVPCKTEPVVTNIMLRNILPQALRYKHFISECSLDG
ncbi:hypothetical protein TIFTF001_052985 [Ficus carica]|uniref:Cation-transporting P-type ATPase C-terminal domain-containing protein n=1 Tax=Ficus carica TaxID=3494 RepID=A0AA88EE92_FICCA|nr:hypothetical protein TIFTF001_052985 [Ficus carica]